MVALPIGVAVGVFIVRWGARQLGAPRDDQRLWLEIGAASVALAVVAPLPFLLAGGGIVAGALVLDAVDRRRR